MTELDSLIEVLQGVREGRKWQWQYGGDVTWEDHRDQSVRALIATVAEKNIVRLAPLPDEIEFNGVMIPAPLRVAPVVGTNYYTASPWVEDYAAHHGIWTGIDKNEARLLSRGIVHLIAEAAAKHGRAMCLERP